MACGLSVTAPAATIHALAGRYAASRVARMVREAQHLELVTMKELERFAASREPSIRSDCLAEALTIRRDGGHGSDSDLEDRVREHLRTYPIVQPLANVEIWTPGRRKPYRVDLVWRELRIAAEVDGTHSHGTQEQRREDARRDVALHRAGWSSFRIAEAAFDEDPREATRDVVEAVTAAMLARCW